MSRWFRFYTEVLNDPKVQNLDPETFKGWVNILCLAGMNGGKIPSIEDVAFALRIDDNGAITLLERLSNATLIDKCNGGANGWHNAPHGWSKRQYKSDSSTARVKRFRNVAPTVTVTPPDTDTEQSIPLAKAKGSDEVFWAEAKAYLGGNGSGALIGQWCRDFGKRETAQAITAAQLERPADRKSYVIGILRKGKRAADDEGYGLGINGPC